MNFGYLPHPYGILYREEKINLFLNAAELNIQLSKAVYLTQTARLSDYFQTILISVKPPSFTFL
jgi:hypothetical protein